VPPTAGILVTNSNESCTREGGSVDQVAAQALGNATRLASLELGCEESRTVGNCDSGYSCAYTNSISWRSATTPMPPETNPRMAFERLFGADDVPLDAAARARRLADRRSVLDVVLGRANTLARELGPSDRRKLDEYLGGVREIERQIERAEKDPRVLEAPFEKPAGMPADFAEYVKLMFDLQVAALQSDLTRLLRDVDQEAEHLEDALLALATGSAPCTDDSYLLGSLCRRPIRSLRMLPSPHSSIVAPASSPASCACVLPG
jgi:hypothetical protein